MRMVVVALVLLMTACASGGSGTLRDMDALSREEIRDSDYTNAYDLVRAMRPRWLRERGPSSINNYNPIQVYVDGMRVGSPNELSTIPTMSVERMKYYSPMEAQARWGLNHTNGAIEVVTRRS